MRRKEKLLFSNENDTELDCGDGGTDRKTIKLKASESWRIWELLSL